MGDITHRDIRKLAEGADALRALAGATKELGDRLRDGGAARIRARQTEAALADAARQVEGLKGHLEATEDVRA